MGSRRGGPRFVNPRFQVTFQCVVSKFVTNLPITFPSTFQWKVLDPVGYQEGLLVIIIDQYEHLFPNIKFKH